MLAIWSKAAQAHSCGCRACSKASQVFIRRTSHQRIRRKATFADVFTACYTTIFGTAAIIDAQRRDIRRQELDREIEKTKAEVDRLRQDVADSFDRNNFGSDAECANPAEAIASICIHPNRLEASVFASQRRLAIARQQLSESEPFTRAEQRHLEYQSKLFDYEALREALELEQNDPSIAEREALNERQLGALSITNSDLVRSLLSVVGISPFAENGNSPLAKIQEARAQEFPHYNYAINSQEAREIRASLNHANQKILSNSNISQSVKIAKIGYNLLVSGVPPGIHNVNILVLEFTRLGWHDLAEVMVKFFYSSRLRPTQQTLVCLLHHYRAKGDMVGFYNVIRRIVSDHPSGAMIRRRSRSLVEDPQSRWSVWAQQADVAYHNETVVERAHRDGPVYEAMLRGLLHFSQVEHAAVIFTTSLQQGFHVCSKTVLELLNLCIRSVDRYAAVTIVRGLVAHLDQAMEYMFGEHALKQFSEKVYILFQLCGLKPATTDGSSAEVAEDLEILGISPSKFQTLSRAIFVNQVSRKLNRVAEMSSKMEAALCSAQPREALAEVLGKIEVGLGSRVEVFDSRCSTYGIVAPILDEVLRCEVETCSIARHFRWILLSHSKEQNQNQTFEKYQLGRRLLYKHDSMRMLGSVETKRFMWLKAINRKRWDMELEALTEKLGQDRSLPWGYLANTSDMPLQQGAGLRANG